MTAKVGTDVERAAEILRQGGLVAFATETVYGLGGNALDADVVARIFAVKNRPHFDPLIVHIGDTSWLSKLSADFPALAVTLTEAFWPGPLSVVVPKTALVPDLVTAGMPTVALRMPDHQQALALLQKANVPVAAPSANLFGRISPTCAAHVADQLQDQVDYILDGGTCRVGVESTVVQCTAGDSSACTLLRPGGVTYEELQRVAGAVHVVSEEQHPVLQGQLAPGMLPRHYAPRTPLELVSDLGEVEFDEQTGLLLAEPTAVGRMQHVEILSATGDLNECATNFFAALRRLDALGLRRIIALRFPERGLGRAINDRLRRAARSA